MKRLTALWLTALVLGMAAPTLAHDGGPTVHKEACDGNPDWTNTGDFTTFDAEINDIYIELFVDRGADGGNSPDVRPGYVWMESNGWDGLQKTDFECQSKDGAHDDEEIPHPDTVLI